MDLNGCYMFARCSISLNDTSSHIRQRKARTGDTKGKLILSPVVLQSCNSSLNVDQNRGFYNNAYSVSSPHLIQYNDCRESETQFVENSLLNSQEVFKITNGYHDVMSSRYGNSSQSQHSIKHDNRAPTLGSTHAEDNLTCIDRDRVKNDKTNISSPSSKRCLLSVVTMTLVLCAVVATAVILAFMGFRVGEQQVTAVTIVRPEHLILEGSLDLIQQWVTDLSNSSSPLYTTVAERFISEMDKIMTNSTFSSSYISTRVLGFSPGSIKVRFDMHYNDNYKQTSADEETFADTIEEHLRDKVDETDLPINATTINIIAKVPTTISSTQTSTSAFRVLAAVSTAPSTDSATEFSANRIMPTRSASMQTPDYDIRSTSANHSISLSTSTMLSHIASFTSSSQTVSSLPYSTQAASSSQSSSTNVASSERTFSRYTVLDEENTVSTASILPSITNSPITLFKHCISLSSVSPSFSETNSLDGTLKAMSPELLSTYEANSAHSVIASRYNFLHELTVTGVETPLLLALPITISTAPVSTFFSQSSSETESLIYFSTFQNNFITTMTLSAIARLSVPCTSHSVLIASTSTQSTLFSLHLSLDFTHHGSPVLLWTESGKTVALYSLLSGIPMSDDPFASMLSSSTNVFHSEKSYDVIDKFAIKSSEQIYTISPSTYVLTSTITSTSNNRFFLKDSLLMTTQTSQASAMSLAEQVIPSTSFPITSHAFSMKTSIASYILNTNFISPILTHLPIAFTVYIETPVKSLLPNSSMTQRMYETESIISDTFTSYFVSRDTTLLSAVLSTNILYSTSFVMDPLSVATASETRLSSFKVPSNIKDEKDILMHLPSLQTAESTPLFLSTSPVSAALQGSILLDSSQTTVLNMSILTNLTSIIAFSYSTSLTNLQYQNSISDLAHSTSLTELPFHSERQFTRQNVSAVAQFISQYSSITPLQSTSNISALQFPSKSISSTSDLLSLYVTSTLQTKTPNQQSGSSTLMELTPSAILATTEIPTKHGSEFAKVPVPTSAYSIFASVTASAKSSTFITQHILEDLTFSPRMTFTSHFTDTSLLTTNTMLLFPQNAHKSLKSSATLNSLALSLALSVTTLSISPKLSSLISSESTVLIGLPYVSSTISTSSIGLSAISLAYVSKVSNEHINSSTTCSTVVYSTTTNVPRTIPAIKSYTASLSIEQTTSLQTKLTTASTLTSLSSSGESLFRTSATTASSVITWSPVSTSANLNLTTLTSSITSSSPVTSPISSISAVKSYTTKSTSTSRLSTTHLASPNSLTTSIASTARLPKSTTLHTTTETQAPDQAPVANAGSDVFENLPVNKISIYGTDSSDDHGISSYLWEKVSPAGANIDMTGTNTAVLTVSNLVAETYVFKLTVTDTTGQAASDEMILTVRPERCTPVTFQLCSQKGFSLTVYPNVFGNMNQSIAEEAFYLATKSVMNQICQESALTYLCSLFFPKCIKSTGEQLYPCHSLCDDAISTCGEFFANPFPCEYFRDSECVAATIVTEAPRTTPAQPICELTLQKECTNLGFNESYFPNLFNEPDQKGASDTFIDYMLPNMRDCDGDAMFLVCSIQFPICRDGVRWKPCRRTCNAVISACPNLASYINCKHFIELDCLVPQQQKKVAPRRRCFGTEFSCGRVAKCIPSTLVCNRMDDCGDWTDEMNCKCDQYDFQCDMGMCIKSYQRCDGILQCPDNSDEAKCDGCTHGQVRCPGGKCIMSEWLCDGRQECEDGFDENNCNTACARDQFECKDRTCVSSSKRCDNIADCPDDSDEWDCVNDDNGLIQIPFKKTLLPICADFWNVSHGEIACRVLGHGPYINKIDVVHNVYAFAKLSRTGIHSSVLGKFDIINVCSNNKVVRVICQPRGCGKPMLDRYTSVVVNGDDAIPGKWPWHVALYFGGQYFCGGSLINNMFVLTAAHCVEHYVNDFSSLTVKLGAHNRESPETTQNVVRVDAIKSHDEHVYFEKNDIALLQLASPVNFTKYIQPICLPEPGELLPLFSTCFTIGWGRTKWDADYAQVLQELKMTLWDTHKCNSSIAWNGEIYETFLCAGYISGIRSICKSDSGGPLLCLDKQKTWKLRGINSYVANFCNMTDRPNVFTNVSKFHGWLTERIECKFRCDNGKCLFNKDFLCDRIDHCGDNSDEIRPCNRTLSCSFDDRYLCGYRLSGWNVSSDNKFTGRVEIDGQLHTQSNAPQFDHTFGRFPGHFLYGKQKGFKDALLSSPMFNTAGQTCIRFSYYLRGDIDVGLSAYLYQYKNSSQYNSKKFSSDTRRFVDEWKTGYFDITLGQFEIKFRTGDLLKAAIDDIQMIPGLCEDVLCKQEEYRCKSVNGDHCIPIQSRCNLAVDCEDSVDEKQCPNFSSSYICTFENGNLCALHQEVDDASDWWLVNASFVRSEIRSKSFVDHTSRSESGHLFYINAYSLQTASHIYMWQLFHLRNIQYCLTFFYHMKSDVTFYIHVDCSGCARQTTVVKSTFYDSWTLVQLNLPVAEQVNVTYDVERTERSDSYIYPFIAIDDIIVKVGVCPKYHCPANYSKCKSEDRCIPLKALCDRKVDCLDESDEENCICSADEFKCINGRCIPRQLACDRIPHCQDQSDESKNCVYLNSVSCTFEHPYMCGYDFVKYTAYNWARHSGITPTHYTGPVHDHTFGNLTGYYMYTEAHEGSRGDNTSLISPMFNSGTRFSIEFYYHVYSSQPELAKPGVLEFALENVQTKVIEVQWQSNMELYDTWRWLCVDLPVNLSMRAWFTSIRNETTQTGVDNAIDDVKLNPYTCAEATTPSQKTAMTTAIDLVAQVCQDSQWMCKDNITCVDVTYRCDNEPDCPDSSDEQNCAKS